MFGEVLAVSRSPAHGFSKQPQARIRLLPGLGVEGDVHAGATAQHLYRKRRNPDAPNLAQVHFLAVELFTEVAEHGFVLAPGLLGENVLTRGIDLVALPTGTVFRVGADAVVEITGIRDPCRKIDAIGRGLAKVLLGREGRRVQRKAGIMGVVRRGGSIAPGDEIAVVLPPLPHRRLVVV